VPATRTVRRWTRALTGDAAQAEPDATVERVRVDTTGVAIDAQPVGDVTATIDGVHLEFGATSEIVTGRVDLEVRASRTTAFGWLRAALPEWDLRLLPGGLIAGRSWRWPVALVGRPELTDPHTVRVHVVGVEIAGRSIRLPKWFARDRTFELPQSAEFDVIDVRLDDECVILELRHEGVRQVVKPAHVRAAIRDGMTRLGASVFT
jgi:hypothetical protein